MKHIISCLIPILFYVSMANAAPVPPDPIVERCYKPTLAVDAGPSRPKEMNLTNNLRRKTGSPDVAKGKPVIIYGKVLDAQCVPASGMRVEVWDAGTATAASADKTEKGKKGAAKGTKKDQAFIGSGTSVTNNLGQFSFLTVIPPGFKGGKLLNVRISAPGFGTLKTVMYLDGYGAADAKTRTSQAALLAHPDTTGITSREFGTPYYITYVLNQANQYRKY